MPGLRPTKQRGTHANQRNGRHARAPNPASILSQLGDCRRVVIVGGPGQGKTTLAAALAPHVGEHRPTDTLDSADWSAEVTRAADWLRAPGPWVVEGVLAVYALRRLVEAGERPPCVVVRMRSPVDKTPLAKAVDTVWGEIEPTLRREGVVVIEA
jgi:hypothetical protein